MYVEAERGDTLEAQGAFLTKGPRTVGREGEEGEEEREGEDEEEYAEEE